MPTIGNAVCPAAAGNAAACRLSGSGVPVVCDACGESNPDSALCFSLPRVTFIVILMYVFQTAKTSKIVGFFC